MVWSVSSSVAVLQVKFMPAFTWMLIELLAAKPFVRKHRSIIDKKQYLISSRVAFCIVA